MKKIFQLQELLDNTIPESWIRVLNCNVDSGGMLISMHSEIDMLNPSVELIELIFMPSAERIGRIYFPNEVQNSCLIIDACSRVNMVQDRLTDPMNISLLFNSYLAGIRFYFYGM